MKKRKLHRLTVAQYERRARRTDKLRSGCGTPLLGLIGEVGTLLSTFKKQRRDTVGYFGYREAVAEELGDVLWYMSAVARRIHSSLAEIAAESLPSSMPRRRPNVSFTDVDRIAKRLLPSNNVALERVLLALASEAGQLAQRFRSRRHEADTNALHSELVKLMRSVAAVAAAAKVTSGKLTLDGAARKNIQKVESRWPPTAVFPTLSDRALHLDEQLPRFIRMEIYEREVNGKTFAYQKCDGILVGDRLTDNNMEPDDYRFHDVFHLAYAAVLGWSPVTRALFRVKRKSLPKIDENQDGARAILIEEGLTAWIFEVAKHNQFFEHTPRLGFDLLNTVKAFVRGYEPADSPMWLWEKAILGGYAVFRKLQENRRGIVIADLRRRTIRFKQLQA